MTNEKTALQAGFKNNIRIALLITVSLAMSLLATGDNSSIMGSITPYITLFMMVALILLVPEVFFRAAFGFSLFGWIKDMV